MPGSALIVSKPPMATCCRKSPPEKVTCRVTFLEVRLIERDVFSTVEEKEQLVSHIRAKAIENRRKAGP